MENVSKLFSIPHEKHTTLKAAAQCFLKEELFEFQALNDISFEVKGRILLDNSECRGKARRHDIRIYLPTRGKVKMTGEFPFS